MLDGTLWIEYNSTCSGNISSTGITKFVYSLPILILSIIALILNGLCISVFSRQHRKSVMRTKYTTQLICSSNPRMIKPTEFILFALINWGSDCSLCTPIKFIYGFLWILSGFLAIVRAFYDYAIICNPLSDDQMNSAIAQPHETFSPNTNTNLDFSNDFHKKTTIVTYIDALLDQNIIINYEAYCFFIFQVIAQH
ncbi:unnamed protein product [Schistosoma turkestanicum]|nr:unnamed protein product [Schistosoma turkestanicum]